MEGGDPQKLEEGEGQSRPLEEEDQDLYEGRDKAWAQESGYDVYRKW